MKTTDTENPVPDRAQPHPEQKVMTRADLIAMYEHLDEQTANQLMLLTFALRGHSEVAKKQVSFQKLERMVRELMAVMTRLDRALEPVSWAFRQERKGARNHE